MKKVLIIDRNRNTSFENFENIIDKFNNVHYYLYVKPSNDVYSSLNYNNISVNRVNNILKIFRQKFDIILFISHRIKGFYYTNQFLYSFIFFKPKVFCLNLLGEVFEVSRFKIFYSFIIFYLHKLLIFLFTLPVNLIIIFFRIIFFIKQTVCNLLSDDINIKL